MDYLWPCMFFVWAAYLWETYLEWRQRQVYCRVKDAPPELNGLISQETFDKSRRYQLDKSTFSFAHDLFKQLEFVVIIIVGAIPYAWNVAGNVTAHFGYETEYEITQSVVFLVVMLMYSEIVGLPWSVYSTFVLEEKHGFNKQTAWFFIKDHIKSFLLQAVLIPLICSGLIFVIKWGGEHFYIYAWTFLFIVTLVLMTVYPEYIAPLFDKYTPLPVGELRSAIEGLASQLGFPLKKILVVEGSRRSAHSNAYFYGFWKNKRIVLFDTLLEKGILPQSSQEGEGKEGGAGDSSSQEGGGVAKEVAPPTSGDEAEVADSEPRELGEEAGPKKEKAEKKGCSSDEILAVLAHELGHWKFSHNLKNICISEINLFLTLFVFGYFINQQDVFTSFGFPDSRPTIIGFILVFQLIFLPYHEVFQFLIIQLIRRFEYQADRFAKSLHRGAALCSALTKLHKDNLSFPIADPLYSAFHHSHPTYLERLSALRKED